MAKTATDIPITQGSGVNLSNFALASGRRRQTVILADADDTGEALCVELPAHDAPDRGSPIKIGGRASASPLAAVGEADRSDSWISLNGQIGVVSTYEPATVYDGGRRVIQAVFAAGILANSTTILVPAVAGLKTKVVSIVAFCTAFTTAGTVSINDGVNTYVLGLFTAAGNQFNFMNGGQLIYNTGVNLPLNGSYFTGTANVAWSVTYYQAP